MKPRKSPPAGSAALQSGLVIASHGRHCVVETADGQRVICHPRGKKSQAVAGDRVLWQASQDEGCIKILAFEDGSIREFFGNYTDYLDEKGRPG